MRIFVHILDAVLHTDMELPSGSGWQAKHSRPTLSERLKKAKQRADSSFIVTGKKKKKKVKAEKITCGRGGKPEALVMSGYTFVGVFT